MLDAGVVSTWVSRSHCGSAKPPKKPVFYQATKAAQ